MADRGTQWYISIEPLLFQDSSFTHNVLPSTSLGNNIYLDPNIGSTMVEAPIKGQLWPRGNI